MRAMRAAVVLLLCLCPLALAGCGGDSNDSSDTTPSTVPPSANEIYERAEIAPTVQAASLSSAHLRDRDGPPCTVAGAPTLDGTRVTTTLRYVDISEADKRSAIETVFGVATNETSVAANVAAKRDHERDSPLSH